MLSTQEATRWLRSGVARVQSAVRDTTPAPPGEAGAGPDVSRFAPGGDQFVQPDQTTCGSSSLVMARMINTPSYGAEIVPANDGDGDGDTAALKERFDRAVLAMHVTTGGWRDGRGTWQLPWPQGLGTPPWAVARQMSIDGGSGTAGTAYRAALVDPLSPARSYAAVVAALDAGQSVPLFIGNDVMARHVVLVTGHTDDALSLYDPSCGQWVNASRDGYVSDHLDVAGWNQPWFTILPA